MISYHAHREIVYEARKRDKAKGDGKEHQIAAIEMKAERGRKLESPLAESMKRLLPIHRAEPHEWACCCEERIRPPWLSRSWCAGLMDQEVGALRPLPLPGLLTLRKSLPRKTERSHQ